MSTRRHVLRIGGGRLLPRSLLPRSADAAEAVEIRMQGNADGSKVWFDPIGVLVQPGQTICWTNRDPGNAHTTTAYHLRILVTSIAFRRGPSLGTRIISCRTRPSRS